MSISMNDVFILDLLDELSTKKIDYLFRGSSDKLITHVCSFENAGDKALCFYRGRDFSKCSNYCSNENLFIVHYEMEKVLPEKGNFILTENPDLCFCIIGAIFKKPMESLIHPTAQVQEGASVGVGSSIGAYACVCSNTVIHSNVVIGSGCSISNTEVGENTQIGSGVKIGGTGLGSQQDATGKWYDFPHFGRVIIGRDVHIQENSVINRGTLSDTLIGNGVRIGPLCCIGHGVQIDANCFISQSVRIAGSVVIGSGAKLWVNSSVRDGVTIASKAVVGMGAIVVSDIQKPEIWVGNPARPIK